MIEDREAEFEASKEDDEKWTDLSSMNLTKEEIDQMSLKEFLLIVDRNNFEIRQANAPDSKKRNTSSNLHDDIAVIKRRIVERGFLEIGTLPWSMLLSIYFLTLHLGTPQVIEPGEEKKFSMDYEGCIEML